MIRAVHRSTLLVVGTGMAGAKVVEDILARAPDRFSIRMFEAEPQGTNNRILLSHFLGGIHNPAGLWVKPLEWYRDQGIHVHPGVRVETIDRGQRVVSGGGGKVVEPYDYLVLATGSRPFVPPIRGTEQQGVFVFRTLEDCDAITGYAQNCDRAIVLGGGLLGLEAARGLLSDGLEVTVVEVAPHLMAEQLDPTGAELLRRKLEAMGMRVMVDKRMTHLLGEGRVTGVRFNDGSTLDTDMAVISCGSLPNAEVARSAGLAVERGIVVDDQLRTSDLGIWAVGECAEHRGQLHGLLDPLCDQVRVLADVVTGTRPDAAYLGSRPATSLKVMGIDLLTMGDIHNADAGNETFSQLDSSRGVYKKLVIRDRRLVGAIVVGTPDPRGGLLRLFKSGDPLPCPALDLFVESCGPDERSPLSGVDVDAGKPPGKEKNKVEAMKAQKDGLDAVPDIYRYATNNNWEETTEADRQRMKWHGVFFRVPTPGNFMMRLRLQAGRTDSRQFRVIADLTDQYGRGFCDLTARQQIQLRWFTLADVPDIWRRLEEVGLHSKQTGMDNVRGVCGCPVAGLTQHELFDATSAIRALDEALVGNREFSNLPHKFNVTITACLENCCHAETQDVGLVPAYRELDGQQVNGFNLLAGGKHGSGGYRPATPLDVFVRPEDAADLCTALVGVFRDHGARTSRPRARLAFLVQDRGGAWLRDELQRRWGQSLLRAGTDMRKKHHADHVGIHPQKRSVHNEGVQHFYVGLLVPVGRITTAQMRAVADLADCYGSGDIRVTVGQNLVVPNIPEYRIGALTEEPLLKELPFDPSPILRGLMACTGSDYCGMALIETKGYALQIARELEKRTEGKKVLPLTIHWSGCPAGCGLHQAATLGLQGCRSRVNGDVVDAAHVCVNGQTGPNPVVATDLMRDVPIDHLVDALEPLVTYLPRR